MTMRHSWMTCDIEGRKTVISGGPRSENGRMIISVRVNIDDISKELLEICCYNGMAKVFIHKLDYDLSIVDYRKKKPHDYDNIPNDALNVEWGVEKDES